MEDKYLNEKGGERGPKRVFIWFSGAIDERKRSAPKRAKAKSKPLLSTIAPPHLFISEPILYLSQKIKEWPYR